MNKKKVILLIAIVAVAVWLGWGFLSGRGSSGGGEPALAKPPATTFEILQANWRFYADAYEPQGSSIILRDFYALVEGKWKHVRNQTPTILSERNGEIKIRRLE